LKETFVKALYIEDLNTYLVKVPPGNYLINGEKVTGPQEITCKDLAVESISYKTNIIKYETPEGDISEEEYKKKLNELDLVDEWDNWPDLDSEFAYRRFVNGCKCIRERVEVLTKVNVQITKVKHEVNKFLTPIWKLDGVSELYRYDREGACWEIILNKMNELGMVHEEKVDYSVTQNKKVWGGTTLRFLTGFGKYFLRNFEPKTQRVTYEEYTKIYNSDKKFLENTIQYNYNLTFGQRNLDTKKFADNLETLKATLGRVEPKQKTYSVYMKCHRMLNDIIDATKGDVVKEYLDSV